MVTLVRQFVNWTEPRSLSDCSGVGKTVIAEVCLAKVCDLENFLDLLSTDYRRN